MARRWRSAAASCAARPRAAATTCPAQTTSDAGPAQAGLDFVEQADNLVLLGPNGVGKTMLAQNLCHQALLRGIPTLFTSASALLADLSERHTGHALQQRFRYYSRPKLLAIDEIGYLSYDGRSADLLFEVVTRRYQKAATVITTNKPFAQWREIFPNANCVVTLYRPAHPPGRGGADRSGQLPPQGGARTQRRAHQQAHQEQTGN